MGLTRETAAEHVNLDVVLFGYLEEVEGLLNDELQDAGGEIFGQVSLVDGNLAVTFGQVDAGYGAFAAAQERSQEQSQETQRNLHR